MHSKKDKIPKGNTAALQHLLNIFLILNIFQLLSIVCLAWLQRQKDVAMAKAAEVYRRSTSLALSRSRSPEGRRRKSVDGRAPSSHSQAEQEQPLLEASSSQRRYSAAGSGIRLSRDEVNARAEQKRGEVFVTMCASLILFAWGAILGNGVVQAGSQVE